MLNVTNLEKKYGNFAAVSNVSFDLRRGEAAALLGPNGAGKSTLIKCILGLLSYTGEIKIDGKDINSKTKEAKTQISYVPQEPALYDAKVNEILVFFARLRKVDPKKTGQVLRQMDLTEHKDKLTSELSGGLKQRLSFAIALLSNTNFLILDEPTSNLDSKSRSEILQLIRGLKEKGYTILFSSHRVDEVIQIADKVLSMNDGKIIVMDKITKLGNEGNIKMVLRFDNGLVDLASAVLQKEGFDKFKKENNSIILELKQHEKIIPIQKLLSEEIIIEDFYIVENGLH